MSVIEETRRRLRERQLAGDDRAGTWARSQGRRRHRRFLKRNRVFVLTAFAVVLGLSSVVVLVVPSRFLQGLIVGVLLCTTVFAILTVMTQVTGTAATGMGALAEQWTASELRPLRKAGWKVVNHFSLRRWDIDHVVIGSSGVLAVETKWSSSGWAVERPDWRLNGALDQVKRNAKDLCLWADFKANGVSSVQPVLFLWGAAGTLEVRPQTATVIDGVVVVYGLEAARSWREDVLSGSATTTLDPATMDRLWGLCDSHAQRRDEHESEVDPPAPTVSRLYWMGLGTFLVGFGSLLLSLKAMQLLGSLWQWGVAVSVAVTATVLVRRRLPVPRYLVGSWLAGLVASVVLCVAYLVSLI